MKAGITSKLFLAIFLACLLVTIAMALALRTSFEYGFVDYLNGQEAARENQFVKRIEQVYAAHGSWAFIENNGVVWRVLLQQREIDARAGDADQGPSFGPPPGPPPVGASPGYPPGPPGADPWGDAHHAPPVVLYDADMKRIAGDAPMPPGVTPRPVRVDQQTVGWLRFASPAQLIYAADRQFQAQQLRATWIIVGLAALLAAGIAMVMARLFLAPVQRLARGTERLARGDYAARLDETGADELHQMARDFNRLAQALEANQRSRRDFIADISHELRTPLAVLRGELEAIEDGVRAPNAATLASLQAEVEILGQLTDDLYELSLADIGALSFEKVAVDVAQLTASTAETFRERFSAKRIALEIDVASAFVEMQADPHRLAQLLRNLLENSLRYTDPDGRVRVAVAATHEAVHIDIQDSYPDVPESLLPRLFDRLFRVDASRSRQSGGAGLGLALCEHIVREHGGVIEAVPSPLGGLWIKIRFLLPKSA